MKYKYLLIDDWGVHVALGWYSHVPLIPDEEEKEVNNKWFTTQNAKVWKIKNKTVLSSCSCYVCKQIPGISSRLQKRLCLMQQEDHHSQPN